MPAATPRAALGTWAWSTPSPLIRKTVTGWAQPIRATTAQPWDTKEDRNQSPLSGRKRSATAAARRFGELERIMQRLLSTYLFVSRKLTPELLGQISEAGFQGVEIFGTRSHFEYAMKPEIQTMASALQQHGLQLTSLHAPTSRDVSAMRESGTPLSICEDERLEKSFSPLRDFVSSVHLHDNRGEKDEHIPPYEGTVNWPAAIKLLKTAPEPKLPLLLELKEKTGPEAPSGAEQLTAARKSLDRFEKAWNTAK